jgi:hypothetical protein
MLQHYETIGIMSFETAFRYMEPILYKSLYIHVDLLSKGLFVLALGFIRSNLYLLVFIFLSAPGSPIGLSHFPQKSSPLCFQEGRVWLPAFGVLSEGEGS